MTTARPSARRDFLPSIHATSYPFISPLSLNLSGRYLVITGAALADGVGYATATAFARAGAAGIAIIDRHPVPPALVDQLKQAAQDANRSVEPTIVTHLADISCPAEVEACRDAILAAFPSGRLDVLINNAAYQEPYATILDADPDVYWRTWEVNVRGLFNTSRAFLPALLDARKTCDGLATMVNISSSGALSVRPLGASYRTSKLAVLRWTEALQLDLGCEDGSGLLAFCVNPGAIKTQLTINEPEAVRERLPHHPELPGDTIAWLIAERKEWLGGRYVSCPWDMEELERRRDEIVREDKLKLQLSF